MNYLFISYLCTFFKQLMSMQVKAALTHPASKLSKDKSQNVMASS